jgi:hypothetical protein
VTPPSSHKIAAPTTREIVTGVLATISGQIGSWDLND